MVVPLPAGPHGEGLRSALAAAGIDRLHHLVDQPTPDVEGLLATHGLTVTTMGRRPDEDPLFFAAAAAAGAWAAHLVTTG